MQLLARVETATEFLREGSPDARLSVAEFIRSSRVSSPKIIENTVAALSFETAPQIQLRLLEILRSSCSRESDALAPLAYLCGSANLEVGIRSASVIGRLGRWNTALAIPMALRALDSYQSGVPDKRWLAFQESAGEFVRRFHDETIVPLQRFLEMPLDQLRLEIRDLPNQKHLGYQAVIYLMGTIHGHVRHGFVDGALIALRERVHDLPDELSRTVFAGLIYEVDYFAKQGNDTQKLYFEALGQLRGDLSQGVPFLRHFKWDDDPGMELIRDFTTLQLNPETPAPEAMDGMINSLYSMHDELVIDALDDLSVLLPSLGANPSGQIVYEIGSLLKSSRDHEIIRACLYALGQAVQAADPAVAEFRRFFERHPSQDLMLKALDGALSLALQSSDARRPIVNLIHEFGLDQTPGIAREKREQILRFSA